MSQTKDNIYIIGLDVHMEYTYIRMYSGCVQVDAREFQWMCSYLLILHPFPACHSRCKTSQNTRFA